MILDLDIAGLATDGTGMKTGNAGSYRIMKYSDPDARQKKHLIITADVRTKKIKVYIEGSGPSEPETAEKHLRGMKVCAFVTVHSIPTISCI